MSQIPTVSEAESHVMDQLWLCAPQTSEDLAATLSGTQGWQLSTVKTLLNRLLHKGAIAAERDGRRFLYSPLLERDAWLSSQSVSLIDRLFGGSLVPLVAQFASQRKLSKNDIAALKALLKEHGLD
jgi:predicted transcriptional regulator